MLNGGQYREECQMQFTSLPNRGMRSAIVKPLLQMRNRHVMLFDALIFVVSPLIAVLLRVDRPDNITRFAVPLLLYAFAALAVRTAVFYRMSLYRRYWRYASVDDLVQVGVAVFISTSLLIIAYYVGDRLLTAYPNWGIMPTLPRSIPIIDALLVFLTTAGIRFLPRLADRWQYGRPVGKIQRVGRQGGMSGHAVPFIGSSQP